MPGDGVLGAPSRQRLKERLCEFIEEGAVFLLAGPRYFGKNKLLANARDEAEPPIEGTWRVISTDLNSFTQRLQRGELRPDEALEQALRQLFAPLRADLGRGLDELSLDRVSTLNSILKNSSRPIFAIIRGLETTSMELLLHLGDMLRDWLPHLGRREDLLRLVLISHLDVDLTMARPALQDAYAFANRWETVEVKELEPTGEEDRTRKYEMATVNFAYIWGFKHLTDTESSAIIMDQLDEVLIEFDRILRKYKIHKIKTIGDTYMAAGGIPEKNITNPIDVVMAALEMNLYLNQLRRIDGKRYWDLSLGIHTGPVTATISGKKKITYDIKGDTVNIASRIQGVGDSGEILISVMTYELIKEFFICEYYGKLPVKYKGDLELFVVNGIRPEFSRNGRGLIPNMQFNTKFKLIQFTDVQEIILDKLEKELPSHLYYHNVKHTVDVVTEVELIGWAEGLDDEGILLLKTAALFHDAGHTIDYDEHEYHGTMLVRAYLPEYGYSQDQIEEICRIIMATKLPPDPGDIYEQIICDADLDYLGRSDMIPVSNTLYKELKEQDKIGSFNDWNKLQLLFITGHSYFTKTARSLREVNKQKQIERIKKLITDD
jgi:class 3 adenylate cyclase